jgi:integrase
MGYSRKRVGRDGKPRYTAYYIDSRGKERSAGTYATKKKANAEWQKAETKLAEGRLGDPARGRQRFRDYVEQTWLPNHVIEASTRQSYTYSIGKHILPEFGDMRMIDVLSEHVRTWIAKLRDEDVQPVTIQYNKTILSAIFTTALNDQVTFIHPCRGVKAPPVAKKPLTIVTPEQFDALYHALPDETSRLLVETAIETGLRWGELSELRRRDVEFATRMLTVSRAVVEVNPKFHPSGGRFLVKDYPKDREYRRIKLTTNIASKLKAHADTTSMAANDLFFIWSYAGRAPRALLPTPEDLGLTEPNAKGRQYRHGTTTAYAAGRCRCQYCRAAITAYRAGRRAAGKDNPRKPRVRDTDGHISGDWFRRRVWRPALATAALPAEVKIHDLRHAHASWLLAGGADLQVVKERLGHASIRTTERYLHTLPDADETAVDAFTRIRNRQRSA